MPARLWIPFVLASLAKKHARIEHKLGDACPRLGDLAVIRAVVAP